MNTRLLMAIIALWTLNGCSKDDNATPPPAENEIRFQLQYHVDGQAVIRDSLLYYNDAGNHYSIHNILYYLSQITLVRSDGSLALIKDLHYADCFDPQTQAFTIKNIPAGDYTSLRFNIGIDSAHNDHSVLPTTWENLNMEWPESMGGGYHFLRFEGYFLDSGSSYGYALHIGTNSCLIPVTLQKNITVTAESKTQLTLRMNVNEWFRNPHTYDLNFGDNNYTMGNMPLMMQITENGNDVFTF